MSQEFPNLLQLVLQGDLEQFEQLKDMVLNLEKPVTLKELIKLWKMREEFLISQNRKKDEKLKEFERKMLLEREKSEAKFLQVKKDSQTKMYMDGKKSKAQLLQEMQENQQNFLYETKKHQVKMRLEKMQQKLRKLQQTFEIERMKRVIFKLSNKKNIIFQKQKNARNNEEALSNQVGQHEEANRQENRSNPMNYHLTNLSQNTSKNQMIVERENQVNLPEINAPQQNESHQNSNTQSLYRPIDSIEILLSKIVDVNQQDVQNRESIPVSNQSINLSNQSGEQELVLDMQPTLDKQLKRRIF